MLNDRSDCDIEAMDIEGNRLYTSAEGGVIRMWTCENLTMIDELNAKRGPILSMVVNGNILYCTYTDCSIAVWDLEKKKVVQELKYHDEPVSVIRIFNNQLYSGDYSGKICMWDIATATLKKQFETTEEVWDLAVSEKYLYSIRDRDLLIQTHLKQVKRTLEGRGPVCRINEKIYMATRDGLGIQIYDDNDGFALINTLQCGDRIINALACSPDGRHLYSGGWDNCLHSWDLNTCEHLNKCDVGQVVNQIRVCPTTGHIFVAGNSGLIAKLMDV